MLYKIDQHKSEKCTELSEFSASLFIQFFEFLLLIYAL